MGQIITIDPVTRIEGHLRIEVEVENGIVKDAWSSGQMFRGIEIILQGRDPRDAPLFVQRSCGVCTYVHYLSSVEAIEDAVGIKIPDNARIIRNLLHGAQFQHDHIVHFYHLHALDWVDVVNALKADPKATATLADNVSNAPWGGASYFKRVQERVKSFVDSGQLGPFANAYWGHPAYKLSPEADLMAVSHYIEALRVQARAAKLHAIFGAKNPHLQSLVAGGVTCAADLKPDRVAEFKYLWKETQEFIKNVYIPDVLAVAGFYKDWGAIGGTANYLAYGDFPQTGEGSSSDLMPGGVIYQRKFTDVQKMDDKKITEHVARSWYEGKKDLHPYKGVTEPDYSDYDRGGRYSWIKAPRYDGKATEVGPLARVLVAYGKGDPGVKKLVDDTLAHLSVPATALFSTLGRTAARALETVFIGNAMENWLNELVGNLTKGDDSTYTPWEMPDKGMGRGLNDVPRGALGHWIEIDKGKIKNYQYVVPSTWNLGPRDAKGQLGPVEEALIGTPIADPKRPVEVLRTVHSFDPCIACAIHVIDPNSNEVYKVKAL
ncbi:[NiFe] hydrogenase large subunit [Desulfatibacillum alkenivorans DSM 16219]|jgi:[NiFe] hydrogenase large subunit|uniref:[NiFe] hydrogenase large subunit n=1 Tax=Desulfatibacillum alkenivorans DSM 16219 TaxID=1121393 RepID=A0A1M6XWH9_9BACT|nr:nickel-dependent hydrogenase large subunit [Desulfatibacillum alkenivorans]SHL10266.1 [NiFe] hydrogenase large subunit [Desulfatibacillum alkenivorans DSM 16219]